MQIFHKNKLLAKEVILSNGFGLMFEKQLKENQALLIELKTESKLNAAIHMLFVFQSIDVLWLNKGKVVDKRTNIKPFTPLIIPKKPAKYILELKATKSKNINIGDKLVFK